MNAVARAKVVVGEETDGAAAAAAAAATAAAEGWVGRCRLPPTMRSPV